MTRHKRGRPSITSPWLLNNRFDLTLTPGFESEEAVTREDYIRARLLCRRSATLPKAQGFSLRRLREAIDPEEEQHPATMASSRYMREMRMHVLPALWEKVYEAGKAEAPPSDRGYATFTALWEGCGVMLGQLHLFNPVRFLATFRQHLYRSARHLRLPLQGRFFVALDIAYDPALRRFQPHVHAATIGPNPIAIVNGLRSLGIYRPAQAWDGRDAANTPVRLSVGPLSNMPEPLTYILKRYCKVRETYLADSGLRKAKPNQRDVRLPEPAHTEFLEFMHRWRLEDVTLLMGMHVTRKGLMLT